MASRERRNRAARRMPAIANALDGMSRADAATAAGMERQALRDAVTALQRRGDRRAARPPVAGRLPALTETELALLADRIFRGSGPREGRREQLDPAGPLPLDRGPLRQAPDAAEPVADPAARGLLAAEGPADAPEERRGGAATLRKRGLRAALAGPRPRRIRASGSRCGSRTRCGSARRAGSAIAGGAEAAARRAAGPAPPGRISSAPPAPAGRPPSARPAEVSTDAMRIFLDGFAATIADDEHAVMVLDRAGWHGAKALRVPPNVSSPAAAVFAPAQPDGAGLAMAPRALPEPARPRGPRRHRRRLLRRLERHRR